MASLDHRNLIEFYKVLSVINAIIHAGSQITSAVAGSNTPTGSDNLTKTIDELKRLLLGDDASNNEQQAQKAKRILEAEHAKGPLRVKSRVQTPKSRNRVTYRSKRRGKL